MLLGLGLESFEYPKEIFLKKDMLQKYYYIVLLSV